VLGNALDRGVGLRQQRPDDLLGLEVALPDGRLLRVGWWPDPQRPTPAYPLGMGPSPLHLFTQSDLGVVTAGVVRLLPRPEALRVVRLNFPPESLVGAVDLIRRWVAQGLVNGVVKVFNPVAARGYGAPDDDLADHHLAHIPVDGTAAAVAALTAVVTDEATASGLFSAVSADDDHEVARLVERSYLGDPDREDTVFRLKIGQPADLLDSNVGFLFFLPLVPFTGADIGRADSLLARVREQTGVRCGATLNVLGPDLVDYVVSVRFQRDQAESERAHRALDLLYPLFHDAGFVPYRLDVDHTDWLDRLSPDQATRRFVRELKDSLDPHRGIAPGRYS
jgi:4-cresol dehydrogenase (hydroxylating)